MIYLANVAKLETGCKCPRSQPSTLQPRCPWPARLFLGAAMTLMMGPAALAQGTEGPSLLLLADCYSLQTVTPWLSQSVPLGAQVGSVSMSMKGSSCLLSPLALECLPRRRGEEGAGRTRCLPENIEPFTPVYCCNSNTGFIFSYLYPVAQHCWKTSVALLDTQTAAINGL